MTTNEHVSGKHSPAPHNLARRNGSPYFHFRFFLGLSWQLLLVSQGSEGKSDSTDIGVHTEQRDSTKHVDHHYGAAPHNSERRARVLLARRNAI